MRLNKLAKKIFAAGLAVSLMMANAGVSFATEYPTPADTSEKFSFEKYLVLKEGVTVPNVSFTYTIEPGQAISAKEGSLAVIAGPKEPVIAQEGVISFSKDDTSTKAASAIEGTGVAADDYYVKKTLEIDFSKVEFKEPGVYRYILKEATDSLPAGIAVVGAKELTLDVYVADASTVGDDGKTKLALAKPIYVLHTGTDAPKPDDVAKDGDRLSTKVAGFTNKYDTVDLSFEKLVAGNQASRDKYFEFTLNIDNGLPNTTYAVDISGAVATPEANAATTKPVKANPTSVTTDDKGKVTDQKFYLQHGNKIVVKGLAAGTTYKVDEDNEDYTKAITGDANEGTLVKPESGELKDINVTFTNTREGTIPTGVILDSAPFILIIGLAAAALVITAARKKVR